MGVLYVLTMYNVLTQKMADILRVNVNPPCGVWGRDYIYLGRICFQVTKGQRLRDDGAPTSVLKSKTRFLLYSENIGLGIPRSV